MFKENFKYFKRKVPEPDLKRVVNVRTDDPQFITLLKGTNKLSDKHAVFPGMKRISDWQVYELKKYPGLIFIVNPFTSCGQRYWIARAVADYSRKPSITNLDSQDDVQRLINGKSWWNIVKKMECPDKKLAQKLRWATFGYHHNWDTKMYSEHAKCPFPDDLSSLSKFIVKAVLDIEFKSEASIVNYYLMDSFLSGHVDHSEPNISAPLLSFSFGQTAIFLIGGHTLEETPEAVFLESGDVILMMGNSRLRYHGVPKILRAQNEPWNEPVEDCDTDQIAYGYDGCISELLEGGLQRSCNASDCVTMNRIRSEEYWQPFNEYINNARINFNVRQVM